MQVYMFALTQHEAYATIEVVTGMLIIFDRNAPFSNLSGITHSHVSHTFSKHSIKELESLESNLVVDTSIGDSLLAENESKGCIVKLDTLDVTSLSKSNAL